MKKGEKPWVKRGLWLVAVVVVIVGLVYLWWPSPVAVDTGPVRRGPLRVTVDEEGRTQVRERYTVSATIGGNLERIALQAGEQVEAGTVLATIRPTGAPLLDPRTRAQAEAQVETARASVGQAQTAVRQAEEAYGYARREASRLAELFGDGVATEQSVDEAEFQVALTGSQLSAARAAVRVAEQQLVQAQAALEGGGEAGLEEEMAGSPVGGGPVEEDGAEAVAIRAPVTGTVLRVFQESAAPVQMGMPLLELGDPARLEIVVDVLTTEAVVIEPGAPAFIEQWGAFEPVEAVVRRVEPAAFTRLSSLGVEEQRVNVVLDVVEAPPGWAAIGDGFRVEARIVTWESEDVLKVDASAVFRSPEGWAVYRIIDGRAEFKLVDVGARTDREVQILDGLDEADEVILYPGDAVDDGGRVERRR